AGIQTRWLAQSESTSSIVFYFSLICAVAGLATWPLGWVKPTPAEWVALLSIGLLGGTAYPLDRKLSLRLGLAAGAVRLYLDGMGAGVGLRVLRRGADDHDRARFGDHRRGRAVRDLARASTRFGAKTRARRAARGRRRRRYAAPNALKV